MDFRIKNKEQYGWAMNRYTALVSKDEKTQSEQEEEKTLLTLITHYEFEQGMKVLNAFTWGSKFSPDLSNAPFYNRALEDEVRYLRALCFDHGIKPEGFQRTATLLPGEKATPPFKVYSVTVRYGNHETTTQVQATDEQDAIRQSLSIIILPYTQEFRWK